MRMNRSPDLPFDQRGSAEFSGDYLEFLRRNIPAAFWVVDRDLKIRASFGKGLEALGLREGEAVGMSLYEYFGTQDPNHPVIHAHLEALAGKSVRYETQRQSRWFESVLEPVARPDGSVAGVTGTALDITEHKRLEQRLQAVFKISLAAFESESPEAFYPVLHGIVKELMPADNFYIALLDREGNLLHFPFYVDERDTEWEPIPADAGLTGYVVRTGQSAIICPSDIARLRETDNVRVIGPEPTCWLGVPLKCAERIIGVICVQSYESGFSYSDQDRLVLEFAAHHIAAALEQQLMTAALARSEERYRDFIANSTEGIWCFESRVPIDPSLPEEVQIREILEHAYLTECNEAFARMYGYDRPEEITGIALKELLPPEDPRTTEYLGRIIRSGYKLQSAESHERDRFGNPKVFLNNISGHIENGMLVRAWGTQTDITERKRLEEELSRLQRLEWLSQLAGGIAHSFNNLLAGIIGNLSLAVADPSTSSPTRNLLKDSLIAAEHCRSLASQLLTFAPGGAPIKQVVEVTQILQSTVLFALSGTRVRPEISLPGDLWNIEADPSQLKCMFENICHNAVRMMPEGGILRVTAQNRRLESSAEKMGIPLEDGPYVEIKFEDNGVGISEQDLPHIFEPFYMLKLGGSALGLAAVHSIVARHNGHITARSYKGGGTVFIIYLPAVPERHEEKCEPLFREASEGAGSRILVMDDQAMIRTVLNRMLTKLGYIVTETSDGAEAVAEFRRGLESGNPYRMVIVDLVVPGGTGGKEILPLIREISPSACVIATTGYSSDPILAQPADFGFDGALAKPFRMEDLTRVVSTALSGPH